MRYRREGDWLFRDGPPTADDAAVAYYAPGNGAWTDAQAVVLAGDGRQFSARLTLPWKSGECAGLSYLDFVPNPRKPGQVPGRFDELPAALHQCEHVVKHGIVEVAPVELHFDQVLHLRTWLDHGGIRRSADEIGGIVINVRNGQRVLGLDVENATRYIGETEHGCVVWQDEGDMAWIFDVRTLSLAESLDVPAGLVKREGSRVEAIDGRIEAFARLLDMPPVPSVPSRTARPTKGKGR